MQEILETIQMRELRFFGTLVISFMASYVVRLKVLPQDVNVDAEKLLASISTSLGPDRPIRSSKNEPIAFGLYALIIDVIVPEGEGVIDAVEQTVSTAPMVGQSELLGVSRLSSTLPKH
jgi:elongation factor 1-beta